MAAVLIDPATGEVNEQEAPVLMAEGETLIDPEHVTHSMADLGEDEPVEESMPEPELPEKYRGKTVAEIAQMHQEAEKALGRQSGEVGELRAAFDEFVQSSVESNKTVQAPEPEVDFFLDPAAAVEQAIANHPKMKQAEAVTAEMKKNQSLAKLSTKFPDMQSTLQDPRFKEWVEGSPIRRRLYQDADKSYDFDSAAELLNNWDERTNVVKQTLDVEKTAQKNEIRKASTGSARSNPGSRTSKKTLRRSDIINLMKTDPRRYEALQPEIMKAYEEGRVK